MDPSLFEYAKSHDILEEAYPFSALHTACGWFTFYASAAALLSTIAAAVFTGTSGKGDVQLGIVAWILFIGVAFMVIGGFACGVYIQAKRCYVGTTVTVCEGMLTVRTPVSTRTVRLDECLWHPGYFYEMLISRRTNVWPFHRVVILVLPSPPSALFGRIPPIVRPAVGFTESTRRRWRSFLTISGVGLGW